MQRLATAAELWVYRVCAWLALACAVGVPLLAFAALPPEIPRHYDLAGNVTATGPRVLILVLPGVALFVYALMSLMQKGIPHLMQMSAHTGKSPADPVQTNRVLQGVKACATLVFAIIAGRTIAIAMGHPDLISNNAIWVPIGLIGLIVVREALATRGNTVPA